MTLLERGFEAVAKDLAESYHDVTAADIRAAHEDWITGKPAEGIVAMFARKSFEDNPRIFGEPITHG